MHAPTNGPSFRTCRSNPEALPGAARVTLSLPTRVAANGENHFCRKLTDAFAPPPLWRPTDPAVPPPERLA